jgi:surfactin synthase thioesterase subunit
LKSCSVSFEFAPKDFIEEFVPSDCELILIGHSIGCKISLEVMKHYDANEDRKDTIRAGKNTG